MGSSPLSVFLYKKEGELKIMHIKRIMVAALAAAMVVTATAPAFAETGNMELEQKDPVQAEEIITPEERKENAEKIEAEKKKAVENENSKKQIMRNISPAAAKDNKDYKMVVLNKSKQKLSIRIDTKNKDITKYEVELRRKATNSTYVIEERRTITSKENICSFKRLMNPGGKYTIAIKSYNEKEKKWSFPEYSEITMDNSLAYKIMSNKEAVRAISDAVNNHKSTVTITAGNFDFYDGVHYGKWKTYNDYTFTGYSLKGWERFIYNGKEYSRATYALKYNLSASKDKALRKKYTSISKKAKGSTKSKIKYFNSYLVKNCKYKLTHKPTNYEFLISWKKGQCSHYANAMKILCDISGIRCECVAGKVPGGGRHAWNIVKIGKKWYWFDSCWADKGKKIDKRWCFKGSGDKAFKKRKLNSQYRTKSWKKAHPMSKKSLKY